jgi:hypothetical protein
VSFSPCQYCLLHLPLTLMSCKGMLSKRTFIHPASRPLSCLQALPLASVCYASAYYRC